MTKQKKTFILLSLVALGIYKISADSKNNSKVVKSNKNLVEHMKSSIKTNNIVRKNDTVLKKHDKSEKPVDLLIEICEENFEGIKISQKYFDSPESVIKFLFERLQKEDVVGAIECFSVKNPEEDLSFTEKILTNKMFKLEYEYPSEYKFYNKVNEISIINDRSLSLLGFVVSLIMNEDNPINFMKKSGSNILVYNMEDAVKIFENLDTKPLNTIKISQINKPNTNLLESIASDEYFRREATLRGGIDKTERSVLFNYKDKTYFICFNLIKYQKGWQIERFGAELSLSTPPGFNICYRTNTEEYFDLIK